MSTLPSFSDVSPRLRRRLRSLRQREDGAEVQLRQVRAVVLVEPGRRLQPDGRRYRHAHVERSERRRHRPGERAGAVDEPELREAGQCDDGPIRRSQAAVPAAVQRRRRSRSCCPVSQGPSTTTIASIYRDFWVDNLVTTAADYTPINIADPRRTASGSTCTASRRPSSASSTTSATTRPRTAAKYHGVDRVSFNCAAPKRHADSGRGHDRQAARARLPGGRSEQPALLRCHLSVPRPSSS
jgi:hypothetical protein